MTPGTAARRGDSGPAPIAPLPPSGRNSRDDSAERTSACCTRTPRHSEVSCALGTGSPATGARILGGWNSRRE